MRSYAKTLNTIWSICIAAFVLMLTCRGEPVSAFQPWPYRRSGIPVTELGDWLPRGRLNVSLPAQNPDRIGVRIRRILQETSITTEKHHLGDVQTEQVPDLTPEILGLARGLENNPLAIYEFVYNHIDFIPTWGLLKNPRETLLAGAGNAFDQASLLSALLRVAGFETRYVWGTIRVPKSEAMNWVGVTDPGVVAGLFASGGIPVTDEGDSLRLNHVWVKVQVESTWYSLDSGFKEYEAQTGQDLGAMTGYDLAAFVSVAEQGSTLNEDFVQNINTTGIEGLLKQYSMNFLGALRAGDTFAYLSDVAGGRRIVPTQPTAYPEQLPYTVVDPLGEARDIPDAFAYILRIQLPGIDYSVNWDDIAGERVTVFYEGATQADRDLIDQAGGIYNVEPAHMVSMVPILRVGGQTVATGSPLTLGTQESITVTVSTPFLDRDGERFWSPAFTQSLIAGEWYALPMRLQIVSQKALARQIQILEANSALGLADDAESVLGQALYVLGMSYFNEVDVGDHLDAQLAGIVPIPHFSIMLASRNLVVWVDPDTGQPVRLDPGSHTVDVQINPGGAISATGDNDHERAFTLSSGFRGSATEHAIIEQLQPVSGISTIQVIHLANTRDGQKIYTVTPGNANRVIPVLSENHHASVINSVMANVNAGWYVVIPEAPVGYKQWLGSGWISLDPSSGSAAYLISGGLGGGSGVEWQSPEQSGEIMTRSAHNDPTVYAFFAESLSSDPVDVTTGSFGTTTVTREDGAELEFDSQGRLSRLRDASGNQTTLSYDTSGRLIQATDAVGRQLSFSYEGGRLTQVTDPVGRTLGYNYDTAGNLIRYADARGRTTTYTYDTRHRLVSITDPEGATYVTNEYDELGRVVAQQDGRGGETQFLYAGGRTTVFDPMDYRTVYLYNDRRRLSGIEDALGCRTTREYDAGDHLIRATNGLGLTTSFAYDAWGHTNVLTYTYDGNNNLTGVTDGAGHHTGFQYDAQFNLIAVTDPLDQVTRYRYDANDGLVSITDANGHETVYRRDDVGRLIEVTDPLGRTVHFTYDCATHLTSFHGADGQIITYTYDNGGRLVAVDYPEAPDAVFAYDPAGHLTHAAAGNQWEARYQYDAAGRLVQGRDLARDLTSTYTYDAAGRRLGTTVTSGTNQFYDVEGVYDSAGRLERLTDQTAGRSSAIQYGYDTAGQLTQVAFPTGARTTYSYDPAGRIRSVQHLDAAGNPFAELAYSFDPAGNPTTLLETTPTGSFTTTYGYDALDRLTQEAYPRYHVVYTYDAVGNRLQRVGPRDTVTYAYDADDQLISRGDERFEYDAQGNLVAWHDGGDTYELGYDAENRLTELTLPDGTSFVFKYDAFGRLIAREGPDGVERFLYDGLQIILAGKTGFEQVGPRYLHGNGLLTERYALPWGFSTYHGDAQGRVRHLSDGSGYPQDAYRYDAFGYPLGTAGNDQNPYRFLGQQGGYFLNGTGQGLHLLGFRYYESDLGRFLTRDPLSGEISLVQSLNDYAYALNNPVRYSDPSGLRPPVLSVTRLSVPESPSEDAIATGRALPQEVTVSSPAQDLQRRTQDKTRARPPASTLRLIEELRGESISGPRSRYIPLVTVHVVAGNTAKTTSNVSLRGALRQAQDRLRDEAISSVALETVLEIASLRSQ